MCGAVQACARNRRESGGQTLGQTQRAGAGPVGHRCANPAPCMPVGGVPHAVSRSLTSGPTWLMPQGGGRKRQRGRSQRLAARCPPQPLSACRRRARRQIRLVADPISRPLAAPLATQGRQRAGDAAAARGGRPQGRGPGACGSPKWRGCAGAGAGLSGRRPRRPDHSGAQRARSPRHLQLPAGAQRRAQAGDARGAEAADPHPQHR